MLIALIACIMPTLLCAAFSPQSYAELKIAVGECLSRSPDCLHGFSKGPIREWDVSNVTDMHMMFSGASVFNGDVSKWDVSRVINMNSMFKGAANFKGDLSKWNVSSVTEMEWMFGGAMSFNGDISKWNVSRVTDMKWMFGGAISFEGDISKWDVSRATDMNSMFWNAISFNADLSKWDVSRVTDMRTMLDGARSFNRILCGSAWVHSKADQTQMFTQSPGSICSNTTSPTTTNTPTTPTFTKLNTILDQIIYTLAILAVVAILVIAVLLIRARSKSRDEKSLPELPLLDADPGAASCLPNTEVGINIEEISEHFLAADGIPRNSSIADIANQRVLPGAMVRSRSSSQYISVTVADLCNYTNNSKDSDHVFVLVAVNFNTLTAVMATLFNVHNVDVAEMMIAFITALDKDEIVVVAAHPSIPRNWYRTVVGMLRSLRRVHGKSHVLDSPSVQVGAKRQYVRDEPVHGGNQPGNVRVIQIPLETITAVRTAGPVPMVDLEGTDRDGQDKGEDLTIRQIKAIVDTFQNIPGVILVTTDTESHLGVDGDVLGVTGYTANEFLALHPTRDFLSPDADRAEVDSLFARAAGEPNLSFVDVDIPHVHKQGHTIWLRACRGTRVIGAAANGNPKVLVVFSDVTTTVVAQREAATMYAAQVCRMELVPAMVYDMVADDATTTQRIVYTNPHSMDIFGLTPDKMTSSCEWMRMLHPDDVERYESSMAESQANMQEWDLEFRVVVASKTKHLHGHAVPHREGTKVMWNGVLQDVTADRNLRELTNNCQVQKAISERFKAASAFLSHEIRNQLHPQSVVLGMMREEMPEWSNKIDMTLDANKTVSAMLSRLFDLSKWESGEFPITTAMFPLMRLFQSIAAYAKAKAATVEGLASIQPTWHVEADEQLLKQAAINLISNASKFSDDQTFVVSVAFEQTNQKEGVVVVAVTDKGRGMTPDQLTKVMVPFGQIRKAREAMTGTGLGLPLTKAMVESGHKGTLTLVSEGLGKGTAATMRVPVLWEDQREEPRLETGPLWWVAPHPGATADILVVDDVKMVRAMVTFAARKMGLTSHQACNGVEAVERMRTNTYSIVFMDRQMPKMIGDVATEQARANGYTLPIVMVSGDTFEPHEEAELKRRGMTAFLNKMAVPGTRDAMRKLKEMKIAIEKTQRDSH